LYQISHAKTTGARELSPFGLTGQMLQRSYRDAIHQQFPSLKDDLQKDGIASFLKEVVIDIGFLEDTSPPSDELKLEDQPLLPGQTVVRQKFLQDTSP
jgi:hypothetical protein